MKKVSFLAGFILTAAFVLSAAFSQAQDSIQYQLVVRNSAGQLITNKQVSMKFSLIGGEQTFYQETMPATTDKFGNISVMVGTGKALKGAMKDVPWSTMEISLKVEADTDGGEKYAELGTVPIAAAPYAMYAATAGGNASSGSPKGDEALFEVSNSNGQPVFAVYDDGIVVYVDQNSADKAKRSGLVVTGRKATKEGETADYFAVDAEGTHIYVDDTDDNTKAKRSGFVVTGRKATKAGAADSKPYADDRSATKADGAEVFAINGGLTTIYVDDTDDNAKAKRSGFVVTGRKATKARTTYVSVDSQSTNMQTDNLTVSNTIPGADATTAPAPILVVTQTKVEMKTDVAMEGDMLEATQGIFDYTYTFNLQMACSSQYQIPFDTLLTRAGIELPEERYHYGDNDSIMYIFEGGLMVGSDNWGNLYFDKNFRRTGSFHNSAFCIREYADGGSILEFQSFSNDLVLHDFPLQFALGYKIDTYDPVTMNHSTVFRTVLCTVNLTIDKMINPYGIEKGTLKYTYAHKDGSETIDYCFYDNGWDNYAGFYTGDGDEIHGKYNYIVRVNRHYSDFRYDVSIDKRSDAWLWDSRYDGNWYVESGDIDRHVGNMKWPMFSFEGVNTDVYLTHLGSYGGSILSGANSIFYFDSPESVSVGKDNITIGETSYQVDKYEYVVRNDSGNMYICTLYIYKGLVLKITTQSVYVSTPTTILECTEFNEGVAESSFHRWLKNSGVTNYNGIANGAFSGVEYDENHYYVDLNLPSGNLWAANNVGAPSSYDWGDYLQWGRFTEPKNGTYADNSYDVPNNLTDSPRLTDAAWRWGRDNDSTNSDWCMPTHADWQELIDNCLWVWVKGEQGVRVYSTNQYMGRTTIIDDLETFYSSNPEAEMMLSGDYIFLPAAGFYSGSSLTNYETTIDKMQGYYWAADKNSDGTNCIAFGKQYMQVRNNSCYQGLQVRAVAHKNTKYWVTAGSNNGDGSQQKPFSNITTAIRKITGSNNTNMDPHMTYTIMIDGQFKEPTTINLVNVKQITLCGVKGLDNNGEPQDAIVGSDINRPLTVSSGNIRIKNLKLTGGSTGDGGGLHIKQSIVTLDSGAFIMQNVACSTSAVSCGGGVFIDQGAKLVMLANSKISNNTAGIEGSYYGQGAGVYMSSNNREFPVAFEMYGGEISGNHGIGELLGTGSQGGGVYIGQNADFTMSGGRITGNELNGICMGGGVYQMISDYYNSFRMLGGEISGNTSSLYNGLCIYPLRDDYALEIGGNAYANAINCLPNEGEDAYIRIVSPLTTDKTMDFQVSNVNASGVIYLSYSTSTSAEDGLSVLEDAIGKLGLSTDEYTIEYSSKNEGRWFECEAKLTPKQRP